MKLLKYLDFIFENKKINYKNNVFLDDSLTKLSNIFSKNNYKLYVVGGAVRDMILNKIPKDIDLVTDAIPDEVENILEKEGIKTIPTGKAFGVITAIVDGSDYEIATFREDLSGGRRPDGVSFTDIENDVKRIDLTINALYYDLKNEQIIDFVGGYDDILNNNVRAVGNAKNRFDEDRLRILRVVRFAGRFNSELDADIDKCLKEDSTLTGVSFERIRDEFYKGIKTAKKPLYYLELLKKYNLFKSIFPKIEIDYNFIDSNEPIFVAASLLKNNDIELLKKEFDGKLLNWKNDKGNSLLELAVRFERLAEVKDLLEKGADANIFNIEMETPLMAACDRGNYKIAKLLVDYKAEINFQTKTGSTPLMSAAFHGNGVLFFWTKHNNAPSARK
jgi:tRNA nucleotidyltransferase/poly(A) polymerase